MDFEEASVEELQHEHALMLVDLQLMHRDYEEDDDDYDENDLIKMQNFECICNRCDRRIDWYHRYYYKCSMSLCNYSLHKFCEDLPTTLKFHGHPSHSLVLDKIPNLERDDIYYVCSPCNYGIGLVRATFVDQNTIHHPIHPHPLICVSVEPGLNKCFACKREHKGNFFHCTTCLNFAIHSDCLSLPIKLLLQTQQFSHRHFLTLSYSFIDQLYDHIYECRICGMKLEDDHFIYKCSKCMYYVHPHCATQRIEPFMSILLPGLGKTEKNFKDANHPNLLQLPLDDESHILPYQIEGETNYEQLKSHLLHFSHEHPLVLMHDEIIDNNDTSRIKLVTTLHDPMKRIKLLCNGCSRPITKMPFYKCSIDDDGCDFALHVWCTRLPIELRNHKDHPQHTLNLVTDAKKHFRCYICGLVCNGFSYSCFSCENFIIDVNCGFMPEEITHEAHANHLLTRAYASSLRTSRMECRACRWSIYEGEVYFGCGACDFYLDCRCALLLPKTIRHKYDKHFLNLSYSPIEDHKSRYFCEVCEDDLDPGKWFYHCVECAQSIHSVCAPLILKSEQGVNSVYMEGVYLFINIKFGGVEKLEDFHQHPVLFAPGTENDGLCESCGRHMLYNMIWKCLHCNFARHYIDCRYTDFVLLRESKVRNRSIIMYRKRRNRRNLGYHPSGTIRPVTGHWKVVDNMQQ